MFGEEIEEEVEGRNQAGRGPAPEWCWSGSSIRGWGARAARNIVRRGGDQSRARPAYSGLNPTMCTPISYSRTLVYSILLYSQTHFSYSSLNPTMCTPISYSRTLAYSILLYSQTHFSYSRLMHPTFSHIFLLSTLLLMRLIIHASGL